MTEYNAEKKSNTLIDHFRKEAQDNEEKLQIIRDQYQRVQQVYISKNKELENEILLVVSKLD